ncbi:methyltransferase family protein [Acidobacteriota bacterium]
MSESQIIHIIYKWRVRSGLLFALIALVFARPSLYSLLIAFGLAIIGLAWRTWACGNLKKEKELTTSGPYKYTRNPLYLGNLILGIAMTIAAHSWIVLAFFIAYFLIFYPVLVNVEKKRMAELFPKQYREYSAKVPLFFPSLRAKIVSEKSQFSWLLYKKNKEYRALIGAILYWTALALKTIFF